MKKPSSLTMLSLQSTIDNFNLHKSDKIELIVSDTKLGNAYIYMLSICTDKQAQLVNLNILNAYEMAVYSKMSITQTRRLCLLFIMSAVYSKIGSKMFTDAMYLSRVKPLCVRYIGNIYGTPSLTYALRYIGNFFCKEETDRYFLRYITNTKIFDEAVVFKQCITEIRTMSLLGNPLLHYESYRGFYNTLLDNAEFGGNSSTEKTLLLFRAMVDKKLKHGILSLSSKWATHKSFDKKLADNNIALSQSCFNMMLYELKVSDISMDLLYDTMMPLNKKVA